MVLQGKMKFIRYFIFFPLLALIGSCLPDKSGKNIDYFELAGYTQGTSYHIIMGMEKFLDLRLAIDSILHEIDQSLSVYDSLSVISRFNRNEPGLVPDRFFLDVLEKSLEIMKKTDGAFDITAAPLINFWGFGTQISERKDTTKIKNILKYVGISKIDLSGGVPLKSSDEVIINLNAIAQGYTVDEISRFLEKNDIHNYLVEIGGEVRAKGKNRDSEKWIIGIDNPVRESGGDNNIETTIRLSGQSVSTSGNYRKFYVENGIRYGHTIDPRTGYPARNSLLSATVIAPDCTTADALATACMVLGYEKSLEMLKSFPGVEAFFICSGENNTTQVFRTSGFDKYLDLAE